MPNSEIILMRLRERIASAPAGEVFPTATTETVALAEKSLGFKLNPFLQEVYLTVANGGFGPSYGLIGLPGGAIDEDIGYSIVDYYVNFKSYFASDWPDRLVPICHYGCNIVSCIDCTSELGPMTTWHPALPSEDKSLWQRNFEPEAASVVEWFEAWLNRSTGLVEATFPV